MNSTKLKREKRAYLAYLEALLRSEYYDHETVVEEEFAISTEVEITTAHIADLDVMIKRHENAEET